MEKVMTNEELTKAVNALLDAQMQTQEVIKSLMTTLTGLIKVSEN